MINDAKEQGISQPGAQAPLSGVRWGRVAGLIIFAVLVTTGIVWWFNQKEQTEPRPSTALSVEELRALTAEHGTSTPLSNTEIKALTASSATAKPLTSDELRALTATK